MVALSRSRWKTLPMPTLRTNRKSPSLRTTWLIQTLVVAGVLVLFGAVAVASSAYQHSTFHDTTSDVERATSALLDLRMALNTVDDSSSGLMYGLGGPDALQGHREQYLADGQAVTDGLRRVRDSVPPEAVVSVERAQEHWEFMDAAVRGAPELFASGAVTAGLAAGADPFTEAWMSYGSISENLAEVERINVLRMRQRMHAVDRVQNYIPVALLAVLALGLLTICAGARRMSLRVVTPLAELRRAARTLGATEACEIIDVHQASAEVQLLADTIQDTAARLRISHGELREQAYTDVLTGLPNRQAFVEELERRFRQPEARVGALFIDLDDFKIVNDSLGHAAGDQLLYIVAARLRAAVREGDLVARLGGDEFAVLVSCENDAAAASVVADKVLAALDDDVLLDGTRMTVDCSVGVAVAGAGVDSADDLLRDADFAMYMAKGRGKNCVEVFAPSMHVAMQTQSDFKRDLSRATALEQLVLHHQPVLDLINGQVLGFEALVRWQHPTRGLVAPLDFIGLAEETGDIVALGKWVLQRACADLARYRLDHGQQELWISVNVSPQQLIDPNFVDVVLGALSRHGLLPQSLILEITEHAAVANTAVANVVLESLRRHGVRIALDDFGVGFSSLRYLRELPVDVIKIDRSYVADIGDRGNAMLGAIVSLAEKMGLGVIAEGIEDTEQLERLQQLGRLAGQGYLFARPMPVERAGLLLSEGDRLFRGKALERAAPSSVPGGWVDGRGGGVTASG